MNNRTGNITLQLFDAIGNNFPLPLSLEIRMDMITNALDTLRRLSVDVNTLKNKRGETLLIRAVQKSEFEIVDLLLSKGVETDHVDASTTTALEQSLDIYTQISQQLSELRPKKKYFAIAYQHTENKTENPTAQYETEEANLLKRQKIQIAILVRLIKGGASKLDVKKHPSFFSCLNEQPFCLETAKILCSSQFVKGVEARLYQEKFETLYDEFVLLIAKMTPVPIDISKLIVIYADALLDFSLGKPKLYQGKFFDNGQARIDFAIERLREEKNGVPNKKSCSIM